VVKHSSCSWCYQDPVDLTRLIGIIYLLYLLLIFLSPYYTLLPRTMEIKFWNNMWRRLLLLQLLLLSTSPPSSSLSSSLCPLQAVEIKLGTNRPTLALQEYLSSPKRPNHLWTPAILLFSECQGILPDAWSSPLAHL